MNIEIKVSEPSVWDWTHRLSGGKVSVLGAENTNEIRISREYDPYAAIARTVAD